MVYQVGDQVSQTVNQHHQTTDWHIHIQCHLLLVSLCTKLINYQMRILKFSDKRHVYEKLYDIHADKPSINHRGSTRLQLLQGDKRLGNHYNNKVSLKIVIRQLYSTAQDNIMVTIGKSLLSAMFDGVQYRHPTKPLALRNL